MYIVSNHLEELLELFKREEQKGLVLVPDLFCKSYLQKRIAPGCHVMMLEELLTSNFQSLVHVLQTERVSLERARQLCQKLPPVITHVPQASKISIFGISTLDPQLHRFFLRMNASYFILSPCMMFWSDLFAKDEDALQDRNRLLANCGEKGRAFAFLLEEMPRCTESYVGAFWIQSDPLFSPFVRHYSFSKNCDMRPLSALTALQTSLLLLNGKSDQKIQISAQDASIQLHACPTLLREVEVLHKEVMHYSGHCLVMAPDIELYKPYIERVFSRGSSCWHYAHPQKPEELEPMKALLQLLALVHERWSAKALLKLFSCEAMCKKYGLGEDDIESIRAAFERHGFSWGYNEEHRHAILAQEGLLYQKKHSEDGTFSDFSKKVLEGAVSEAVSKFLQAVHSLYRDLDTLLSQEEKFLEEWSTGIKELCRRYIADDSCEMEKVFVLLKETPRITQIPFSTARELLYEAMKEALVPDTVDTDAPTLFCSLGQSHAYPVEMLCLIGMGANAAIDKYHVIEAVGAVRQRLHISYQCFSYEEKVVLEPASCILDLLDTLSDICSFEGEIRKKHPLDIYTSCSKNWISIPSKNGICIVDPPWEYRQYSQRLLSSHLPFFDGPKSNSWNKRCIAITRKEAPLIQSVAREVKPPQVISVRMLEQAARSPLSLYFQNAFSLRLDGPVSLPPDPLFAALGSKNFYKLRKKAFTLPQESVKKFLENEMRLLPLVFNQAALSLLEEETSDLKKRASEMGINPEHELRIEFLPSSMALTEVSERHWHAPPIVLGDAISVVGVLDGVYAGGYLFFGEKSGQTLVRSLPKMLLGAYAAKQLQLPIKNECHFLKDAKRCPPPFQDVERAFQLYVKYALSCLRKPLCLYPEWVNPLQLHEELPKQLPDGGDSYLEFFLSRTPEELLKSYWKEWRTYALEVFGNGI